MIDKRFVVFIKMLQELDPEGKYFATISGFNLFYKDYAVQLDFQRKIFLLQEACGIPLGLCFGWNRTSEGLAETFMFYWEQKEYNKDEIGELEKNSRELNLKPEVVKAIQKGKELFEVPVGITEHDWIALVNALYYTSIYLYKTALLRDKDEKIWSVTKEAMDKLPELRSSLEFVGLAWKRLWNCLETNELKGDSRGRPDGSKD